MRCNIPTVCSYLRHVMYNYPMGDSHLIRCKSYYDILASVTHKTFTNPTDGQGANQVFRCFLNRDIQLPWHSTCYKCKRIWCANKGTWKVN